MLRIILSGVNGQMGKVLTDTILAADHLQLVAGIDRSPSTTRPFPIYSNLSDVKEAADVVIDFSHFSHVHGLLHDAIIKHLPIVVATTGLDDTLMKELVESSTKVPVFYSANMSLGINAIIQALQLITPHLEADFDIEIIEKHHNRKKDAPSGTALLLADSINETCESKKEYIYGRSGNENENPRNQMGIHAVRGGTIPGEHTILYAGNDELIEIKHTALSRDIFANGALKAAQFLVHQKNGLYSMKDLLSNEKK